MYALVISIIDFVLLLLLGVYVYLKTNSLNNDILSIVMQSNKIFATIHKNFFTTSK